ncbi:MAG: hypothetical protein KBH07_14230, partial [Flavobacteriales bacterium]|nr:hypothetical protein [Flavobacteriales bacterium]
RPVFPRFSCPTLLPGQLTSGRPDEGATPYLATQPNTRVRCIRHTPHPTPHARRGVAIIAGGLVLLSIGMLVSCNKDPLNEPSVPGNATSTQSVHQLVQAFVAQAQGGTAKSMETMSVDSAVWYVEAGLNYSLAKAWVEHNEETVDSPTVVVPCPDGMITDAAASDAFNTLYAQLAAVEHDGVQHLALVDVVARTTGDNMEFITRYTIGSNYEKVLDTNYPSWISLNWWTQAGDCSCSSVPSTVCAEKKIQHRVRSAIMLPMQPGEYFTNVETWSVDWGIQTSIPDKCIDAFSFGNPQNVPGHSNMDYPIYLCGDYDCSPCLDASDLSFHTQGVYDVLSHIRNNYCPSKQAVTLTVDGDLAIGQGSTFLHFCSFTFGVKTSSNQ